MSDEGRGELSPAQEAAVPGDEQSSAEPPREQKRLKFPTALTVLAIVLLVVWMASFFIPSGATSSTPRPAGRSRARYQRAPRLRRRGRGRAVRRQVARRPVPAAVARPAERPLRRREHRRPGYVSADEEGFLYGSAQIFLFVLAVGAFITMTMKTGAIETGIGRLALRFRRSPAILVAVLMARLRARRHDATACGRRRSASSP